MKLEKGNKILISESPSNIKLAENGGYTKILGQICYYYKYKYENTSYICIDVDCDHADWCVYNNSIIKL